MVGRALVGESVVDGSVGRWRICRWVGGWWLVVGWSVEELLVGRWLLVGSVGGFVIRPHLFGRSAPCYKDHHNFMCF